MGKIIAQAQITNLFDEDKFIQCPMFVDTGASALMLPMAWKERLGTFKRQKPIERQLANQDIVRGQACWPVEIEIEGFRPIANEVILDMGPSDKDDE